jgi:hypothetical protein
VVTKWQVRLIEIPEIVPTKMAIFRPTADPKSFTAAGETPTVFVSSGLNTFNTRIPVQAGDRIGTSGAIPGGALLCLTSSPSDVVGIGFAPVVGSLFSVLGEQDEVLTGVLATVEPDADGDGFGDETQDQCPQSAAIQTLCPAVVLDAFALPGKGFATVLVASSTEAPITVNGTVSLPKGKAKLKKATKKVKAGQIGKFKLKFPGKLKSTLSDLPSGKSLTLKVTASATNVAGTVSKDKAKLKLKATG